MSAFVSSTAFDIRRAPKRSSIDGRTTIRATTSAPSRVNVSRREESYRRRLEAAELAKSRTHEEHFTNGDEYAFRDEEGKPSHIASFTKGLPHGDDGQITKPEDFAEFVKAIDTGDVQDFRRLSLGPENTTPDGNPVWRSKIAQDANAQVRAWESMSAGLAFDLEGPDAQSITMPPAPKLLSKELEAEIAELYLMALARDVPITQWQGDPLISFAIDRLNELEWFSRSPDVTDDPRERARRRGTVSLSNLFRGVTPGAQVGPYLSQFLLVGSRQIGEGNGDEQGGLIQYGALTIDQRVRIAAERKDFMTTFESFLDVQDGADLRGAEDYRTSPGSRLIRTPRDLATYVHFDGTSSRHYLKRRPIGPITMLTSLSFDYFLSGFSWENSFVRSVSERVCDPACEQSTFRPWVAV